MRPLSFRLLRPCPPWASRLTIGGDASCKPVRACAGLGPSVLVRDRRNWPTFLVSSPPPLQAREALRRPPQRLRIRKSGRYYDRLRTGAGPRLGPCVQGGATCGRGRFAPTNGLRKKGHKKTPRRSAEFFALCKSQGSNTDFRLFSVDAKRSQDRRCPKGAGAARPGSALR